MAADYYMEKENLFILDEDQKVRLAVERLGLNSVAPFDPGEKIIEYRVAEAPDAPLAAMRLKDFVEEVASRSSAPGGGSVSALLVAMGAGLGAMVGKLTYGVRKFEVGGRTDEEKHSASARCCGPIDSHDRCGHDGVQGLHGGPSHAQGDRDRTERKGRADADRAQESH